MTNDALTVDKLLRIRELVKKPPLYYATSLTMLPGQVLSVARTSLWPTYFICHPDDLDKLISELSEYRTLIDLRKWDGKQEISGNMNDIVSEVINVYERRLSANCPHNFATIKIYGEKNYFGEGLHIAQEAKKCRVCGGFVLTTYKTNQWYETYQEVE